MGKILPMLGGGDSVNILLMKLASNFLNQLLVFSENVYDVSPGLCHLPREAGVRSTDLENRTSVDLGELFRSLLGHQGCYQKQGGRERKKQFHDLNHCSSESGEWKNVSITQGWAAFSPNPLYSKKQLTPPQSASSASRSPPRPRTNYPDPRPPARLQKRP